MQSIFLVEDSKFLRMASEQALARAGYSVVSTDDGEQALLMARERHPDLIRLDMLLPSLGRTRSPAGAQERSHHGANSGDCVEQPLAEK